MTRLDRFLVRLHAMRIARQYGVPSGDPRLREIERDAFVLVQEGASPREAAELVGGAGAPALWATARRRVATRVRPPPAVCSR